MLFLIAQLPFSAKLSSHSPPPPKKSSEREREYLRPSEVESLMAAARPIGRHGIRDAALILLMFRHGLRTAELVTLKWSSVDLKGGYLEIHRVKHGHDSIHPLRSPELRALRQLQRDYPETQYVFVSERKAPLSTRSVRHIIARAGKLAGIPFPVHPHQLRHACGSSQLFQLDGVTKLPFELLTNPSIFPVLLICSSRASSKSTCSASR